MKHWFLGEWIENETLEASLEALPEKISQSLQMNFSRESIFDALDSWGNSLIENPPANLVNVLIADVGNSSAAKEVLAEVGKFCLKESLLKKLNKELGGADSLNLTRVRFDRPLFEKNAPLGVVTHILPGNATGLALLACIESMMVGNMNILKLSSRDSDFALMALDTLCQFDSSGWIKANTIALRLSSSKKDQLGHLLNLSDGVSCWGGEGAIASVREMTPSQVRFIPWGHKISFSYVVKSAFENKEQLQKLAFDCVFEEQQACSSPQCVFVEADNKEEIYQFAKNFYELLKIESDKTAAPVLDIQEQAEITNTVEMARLDEAWDKAFVFQDDKRSVRLLVGMDPVLTPSPLFRTVWLKPVLKNQLTASLRPWRPYLQTCSLLCSIDDQIDLTNELLKSGVTRITQAGMMLETYEGEPHDGVFALQRFTKRVRVELPGKETFFRLNEVEVSQPKTISIMDKAAFQSQRPNLSKAHLYFRSGGSSGKPKLSLFSYDDYHSQMQAASEGLLASGLNPSADRVMNLFFGGGLYGGFLSFYTILEKLQMVQLPMAASEDFDYVASMIVEGKVNTLMGMPSYILQLLRHSEDVLKSYGGLEKIYFGGEHFPSKQREWVEEKFGVKKIVSASYGSVDAGPLGYQCSYCEGGVHHLNTQLHQIEILDLEEDKPVAKGEVGRLVVSTHHREALDITRYDIGDLGRWLDDPCKCGRISPRFELLGRHGDIFRAAGTFFNYNKIGLLLGDYTEYSSEYQIRMENSSGQDRLILVLDKKFNSLDKNVLIENYKDLKEAVILEKTLAFVLEFKDPDDFKRTSGSGKLIHVIDERVIQ